MRDRLLIVGASGRAAAASAIRAGFEPFVIDLFSDDDTKRLSPTLKCDPRDYPHGFIELAKRAPPGQWMYTGGLENYPDVVAAISEGRSLMGNGPEVLRLVRDPWFLDAIPKHTVGYTKVAPRAADIAPKGWLRKPLVGAGGGGVRQVESADRLNDLGVYYQERVNGEPESSLYMSTPTLLSLGRTFQFVGTPWLHAKHYQYAGSVTRPTQPRTESSWQNELCERTGLRGVFGIDFIGMNVLEVNPRYTASVEVFEFAHLVPVLNRTAPPPPATHIIGKGIYYAAKPITFPDSGPWAESLARCTDVWQRPDYADIPPRGTLVEQGQPVLTLMTDAGSEAECVRRLKLMAAGLDQLFKVPTPPES